MVRVVVVQLGSGCGRNEWNGAFGRRQQRRGAGKLRGGGEQERAELELELASNDEQSIVVVVVSQDGIGTINMVVLGKGELNPGRVSADIRADPRTQHGSVTHNGMGLRARPSLACH